MNFKKDSNASREEQDEKINILDVLNRSIEFYKMSNKNFHLNLKGDLKQKYFIDSHKGVTPFFIIGLISYYNQWDNFIAFIYLALHRGI